MSDGRILYAQLENEQRRRSWAFPEAPDLSLSSSGHDSTESESDALGQSGSDGSQTVGCTSRCFSSNGAKKDDDHEDERECCLESACLAVAQLMNLHKKGFETRDFSTGTKIRADLRNLSEEIRADMADDIKTGSSYYREDLKELINDLLWGSQEIDNHSIGYGFVGEWIDSRRSKDMLFNGSGINITESHDKGDNYKLKASFADEELLGQQYKHSKLSFKKTTTDGKGELTEKRMNGVEKKIQSYLVPGRHVAHKVSGRPKVLRARVDITPVMLPPATLGEIDIGMEEAGHL
jgi:hypothetical protein